VIAEDKTILEAGDPDATIDLSRRVEAHMPSDRPGIIMRRRLLELLRAHGEDEITNPSDIDNVRIVPSTVRELIS
jgi:hypothetical protein